MKKISNRLVIAISLIVITCIIYYFQNIKEYKADIPMSGVIVAKETIPENTIITKDMIFKDARYTHDLLKQKGYLTSKEEKVLGKRTRVPIYKDEPVNLKRLIENEPYMDEKDSIKRTMFVIAVENLDKALNIKKGSYIDIWLEPNENGMMALQENNNKTTGTLEQHFSTKLFEKLKVYDTKTEIYTNPTENNSSDKKKDTKETTITFLTLYLTDDEIAKYLNVLDWNVNKRVTLYGENVEYSIINEKLEDKPEKQVKKEGQEQ